jgi:hypothetical protein
VIKLNHLRNLKKRKRPTGRPSRLLTVQKSQQTKNSAKLAERKMEMLKIEVTFCRRIKWITKTQMDHQRHFLLESKQHSVVRKLIGWFFLFNFNNLKYAQNRFKFLDRFKSKTHSFTLNYFGPFNQTVSYTFLIIGN